MPDTTLSEAKAQPAADRIDGAVHDPRRHDSAHKHVSGEAVYIDDIPEPAGLLHVCLGLSEKAHARIRSIDLGPVRAAPGVVRVFTAADVPGENDIGCNHLGDEPLFATELVQHVGQPVFAVAAETRDQARRAARLAVIDYEELAPVLDYEAAKRRRHAGDQADDAEARRRQGGDRGGAAAGRRADADRRAGAFLPGEPGGPGPAGRGWRRHRPFLDPASERGAAHRGRRAGRARRRGDGRDPAHGRRLRRQGDPGQPVRRHGRPGGQDDRPRRQAAAGPRRRHGDHRQAPRFRGRLLRRLRRGGPDRGRRDAAGGALRLVRRPVRAGHRPRPVPRRQRLLLPGGAAGLAAAEDQHPVEHRLPRLRRAAGRGGGRKADRGDRLRGRPAIRSRSAS